MIEQKTDYPSNFQSCKNVINTAEVYDDGFLRVEHHHYYVTCGGKILKLGRSEFLLVSIMVRNADRFIKVEDLWNYVWQGEKPFNHESLKVSICNLRQHFIPFEIAIETMAKVGYKLVPFSRKPEI